jgi:hypothetical protein
MGRDAEPKKGDRFLRAFVWGAERPGDARREADAGAPRRTGIRRRDVAPPSGEVAFEGRRWRTRLYLADPLGERDFLELASEGSTIRLLGHFGADGEFMEVHRTRKG